MNKRVLFLWAILLPILSFGQNVLVIKNVAIVDVKANKVNRDKTVIIRGNRITSVSSKVAIPKAATVIDAKGKYLIPGLWDMHAHTLTDNRYEYSYPLLIANGVTGVREMGNNLPPEKVNQLRRDVSEGKMLGPRYGALTYKILDGPGTPLAVAEAIATPERGREMVKMYKQQGADFIKPYNLLPREVYLAIVDEATQEKIDVEGHVPFSMTAAEVSDLGQRTIEHNFDVLVSCSQNESALRKEIQSKPQLWGQAEAKAATTYDEEKAKKLFARFVHNDTWSCPTIIFYRPVILVGNDSLSMSDSTMKYIPKSQRESWHEGFQRLSRNITIPEYRKIHYEMRSRIVNEMYHAGVHILAGTDTGAPFSVPGFSLHDELEQLVEAGLSPIDALRAATLNPAKFLHKEKELGTVEKGKIADLVLLDANPLVNITNTKKIFAVIVNGKLLQRNDLDALLEQVKELVAK
jgi:imidazolonepropionase-like amidohydrolase